VPVTSSAEDAVTQSLPRLFDDSSRASMQPLGSGVSSANEASVSF
jgi:hypothetical protein